MRRGSLPRRLRSPIPARGRIRCDQSRSGRSRPARARGGARGAVRAARSDGGAPGQDPGRFAPHRRAAVVDSPRARPGAVARREPRHLRSQARRAHRRRAAIRNRLRTTDSQNVAGRLPGADARLRSEYVVYTAHWDHFGKNSDGIFHGAEDDALG
ncbi:MAG: hypothetical protein DMG04_29185 [Acidobacteria bacterium]|nr:MAG: hypothetical protein DMG04_29185 [Acidobacteriota bacterium]